MLLDIRKVFASVLDKAACQLARLEQRTRLAIDFSEVSLGASLVRRLRESIELKLLRLFHHVANSW